MINIAKSEGFVIIVACLTLAGVAITAGVTYYCHTHPAKTDYQLLMEDKENKISAQVNGDLIKDEHFEFVALVGDILATPTNTLFAGTKMQIPLSKIKYFLTALNRETISGIFTRHYRDEFDQMQEETVRCASWPFTEDMAFTAQKVNNSHIVCNISTT